MLRACLLSTVFLACAAGFFALPGRAVADTEGTIEATAAADLLANTSVGGVWTGLLQGGSFETTGRARVVLNRLGRGSASVRIGDEPNCVVGMWIQPDGSIIRVGGDPDMAINLRLILRDGLPVIVGTVTDDGHTVAVELVKAAANTDIAASRGSYTVAFASTAASAALPVGVAGAGVVRVGRNGNVSLLGRLADGSIVAQGTQLDRTGKWQLFARTTSGALISGAVEFGAQPNSDCTGALTFQPDSETQAGTPVSLVGSRYDRKLGFGAAANWTLDAGSQNTGALAQSTNLVTASFRGPLERNDNPRARVQLIPEYGIVSGSFVHAADGKRYTLSGIVFQKTNSGAGVTRFRGLPAGTFTIAAKGDGVSTSGGAIKVGSGTLQLGGGNIYTGGTLVVSAGSLTLSGGVLSPGAATVTSGSLTLTPGFSINTFQPPITTTGATISVGNGISGGLQTFPPLVINPGPSIVSGVVITHTSGAVVVSNNRYINPGTLLGSSGLTGFAGNIRLMSLTSPIPAWHFEPIGDSATITLGAGTEAIGLTGAQLKAAISDARGRGDSTLVIGGVTFDLAAQP